MTSAVTQHLIGEHQRRDALGVAKYGQTLDRTDLSATDWLQHQIEELMDGAGYAEALRRKLTAIADEMRAIPAEKLVQGRILHQFADRLTGPADSPGPEPDPPPAC